MDIQFEQLIEALNKKKDTHPNLTKVWIQHLKNRRAKLLNEFSRCENLLVEMENKDDVSMENLFLIVRLMSQVYSNNNT